MKADQIEQLLHATDEQAVALARPRPDLAQRVLETARRRRIRRRGAAIALLLGLVAAPIGWHEMGNRHVEVAVQTHPAVRDGLEQQILSQEKLVRRLELNEQMMNSRARLATLDERPTEDDVTERAASAMVYQADRLLRGARRPESAMQTYQQVINYFPQTVSAGVARQRVAEIGRKES